MIADLVICQIYKEVTNGENKPLTKDNGFIGLNRGWGGATAGWVTCVKDLSNLEGH